MLSVLVWLSASSTKVNEEIMSLKYLFFPPKEEPLINSVALYWQCNKEMKISEQLCWFSFPEWRLRLPLSCNQCCKCSASVVLFFELRDTLRDPRFTFSIICNNYLEPGQPRVFGSKCVKFPVFITFWRPKRFRWKLRAPGKKSFVTCVIHIS